jgi:hypothetical protein
MRSPIRNCLLSVATGLLFLSIPLAAQEPVPVEKVDPGPFYGFWEFKEPAGDTCVVIIKQGGRLSRFWAGTSTKAIEKGRWERTDIALTARWDAGNVDVFRMLGDNAIERDSYPSGSNLLQPPALTIRGVRVDSRVPGSLTIKQEGPRTALEDVPDPQAAPAIPLNNAYVGFWKVQQSTGLFGMGGGEPHFYLQLSRDGSAAVALRDWEGDQGVRGTWRIEGERVVISWPNNRRDVLTPKQDGGYTLGNYRPKDSLDSKPRDPVEAVKVTAADAERYFQAGNFARLTVVDIRGTWAPKEPTDHSEYVSIEGWGNAYRFPAKDGGDGTDPGKWRLLNDRVIITWVDGSKDVIRIAFPNFVQDTFEADTPLTGTPRRSIPVILTSKE